MSNSNPYASFLDHRPVATILTATPILLSAFSKKIGPEKIAIAPAPGKWSPAETICHLADTEIAFAFRLRQTLAQDNHVIQTFDQDKWAIPYASFGPDKGAEQALAAFNVLRNWNMLLITTVLPASADKSVTHPELGALTFATIVATMAGHDLNHIQQLQKIADQS
ncbi:DinB family protein [Acidicapsa ligni]|uniref:DinB family protein n=1 Tax=Acidicapsa ligni TaxID=542300 RepID=UPI0021E016C5|nr:DinB family protein [Acidicapsa ligni]